MFAAKLRESRRKYSRLYRSVTMSLIGLINMIGYDLSIPYTPSSICDAVVNNLTLPFSFRRYHQFLKPNWADIILFVYQI